MWSLHMVDGGRRGLEDAVLSIGILDPRAPARVYDFGLGRMVAVTPADIVAIATGDPAAVNFAPELGAAAVRAAANRKVLPFRRRQPEPVPIEFETGYTRYARHAALFWREHAVGPQPLLAAGVFSLASIQTPIVTALRLFSLLTPHVIEDRLPAIGELTAIVRQSGAGLDSPKTGRPRWFVEYERYRHAVAEAIADGARDDALRQQLSMDMAMPLGLGLAKLSFTLALVGNNLGCLDARIINWAFTKKTGEAFTRRIARKRPDGRYSAAVYADYRAAEQRILTATPFYDAEDPVALARSQWMLWESLGPGFQAHSHEELFAAVQDPAILATL